MSGLTALNIIFWHKSINFTCWNSWWIKLFCNLLSERKKLSVNTLILIQDKLVVKRKYCYKVFTKYRDMLFLYSHFKSQLYNVLIYLNFYHTHILSDSKTLYWTLLILKKICHTSYCYSTLPFSYTSGWTLLLCGVRWPPSGIQSALFHPPNSEMWLSSSTIYQWLRAPPLKRNTVWFAAAELQETHFREQSNIEHGVPWPWCWDE